MDASQQSSCKIEDRLHLSKQAFTSIIEMRKDATTTLASLHDIILRLDEIYKEFIKECREKMFIFGLDSLHFQSKMLNIEYNDMNRLFLSINNRMYCEYYKLFKIISNYICENATEAKILDIVKTESQIPQYLDLEPFKEYDFELIQKVHDGILTLLVSLNSYLGQKDYDLKNHQTKNKTGLNIDNFVTTFQFNNVVMREKIHLFINYLDFFHKLHSKYLKRFTTKAHLMHSHVKHDIKLDDAIKKQDKQLISQMKEEHENSIILELKDSLDDDTNTNSSVSIFGGSEAEEQKYIDSVEDIGIEVEMIAPPSPTNEINDTLLENVPVPVPVETVETEIQPPSEINANELLAENIPVVE